MVACQRVEYRYANAQARRFAWELATSSVILLFLTSVLEVSYLIGSFPT